MFENLHDITIQGGCFEEPTLLEGILKYPINILYGMNGMGKSSISRAFANFANPESGNPYNLVFEPAAPNDNADRVFVFNEDFVDKNIKVSSDGLESIVMIGDTIGLQEHIDSLQSQKDSCQNQLLIVEANLNGSDSTDGLLKEKNSAQKQLKEELHKEGAADHRNQRIRKMKQRRAVDIESIRQAPTSTRSQADILNEINEGIAFIENSTNATNIVWNRPLLPELPLTDINTLLTHSLRKAELNSNDEFLLRLANDFAKVQSTKALVDSNADRCPLCHQPIHSNTLNELKIFVEAVLNEEVNSFQDKLSRTLDSISTIQILFPELPDEFSSQTRNIQDAVDLANRFVQTVIDRLSARKASPYDSLLQVDENKWTAISNKLNAELTQLEQDINKYNQDINNVEKRKNDLLQLNLVLAHLENAGLISKLVDIETKINKNETERDRLTHEINSIESQITGLQNTMKQTDIAMEFINDCIRLVFCDSERLQLSSTDDAGKYKLYSRGAVLAPNRVSVGERNILALAYFFASIAKGKRIEQRYSSPSLIIIDDPISSFDKGSRAGVLALIRCEIEQIIKGNRDNKILVMSHDRSTVRDFKSMREEACPNQDNRFYVKQIVNYSGVRKIINYNDRGSDYAEMLSNVYCFAHSDNPDDPAFNSIGNQMRQIMETFAKLIFNTDYKKMLRSSFAWNSFHLMKYRNEDNQDFKNRLVSTKDLLSQHLSRSVLNSESHSSAIVDLNLTESPYSTDELVRLSRCILLFIDGIASDHLHGYLEKAYRDLHIDQNFHLDLYELFMGT